MRWRSLRAGRPCYRRPRTRRSSAGTYWRPCSRRGLSHRRKIAISGVPKDKKKMRETTMLVRIAAALALMGALALPAKAGEYPDHAIKMIVPFAAGGGTDVIARIIAQNLNAK